MSLILRYYIITNLGLCSNITSIVTEAIIFVDRVLWGHVSNDISISRHFGTERQSTKVSIL